jgi:hypothetical protein
MAEYITIRLSLVNLFGIPSKTMELNYPNTTPLIQILQKFLMDINQVDQLGVIAVLNQNNQILDLDWVYLPLNIVVESFGDIFTIVDRGSVNGPDLSQPYPIVPAEKEEERLESMDFGESMPSSSADFQEWTEDKEEFAEEEKKISKEEMEGQRPSIQPIEAPPKPSPSVAMGSPSLRMPQAAKEPAPPSPPGAAPPSPLWAVQTGAIPASRPAMPQPKDEAPEAAPYLEAVMKEKKKEEAKTYRAKKAVSSELTKSKKAIMAADMEMEEDLLMASPEAGASLLDEALSHAPTEPDVQTFEKNISLEYFDKMNPEKYYPLVVDIANIEQAYIAPEENLFTGERKIQTKEKTEFKLKTSIVMVRPVFPGCVVSPPEIRTDFKDEKDRLTFYITPLVKDSVEGRIDFVNEGIIVHTLKAPTSVDDPRYAKTIAAYGSMASVLPRIFPFFGIDFGQEMTVDETVPMLTSVFGGMVLANVIAILGVVIALVVGGFVYYSKKPNSVKRKFTIGDLRMKKSV